MAKQLQLLKDPRKNSKLWWVRKQYAYGGALNYRKVERPFDSKKLTHAVFKAKLGNGIWFTRSQKYIQILLKGVAERYDIKLRDVAINKDHIHIVFYTKIREDYVNFLRLFAAEMGRKYARIHKRFGLKPISIWIARPFTRLVSWGKRSQAILKHYLQKNRDEALGFVAYMPRKHALTRFLSIWEQNLSSA